MTDQNKGLSYSDAGVDIDAGNELVERIKPSLKKTNRPGVSSAIGGFGGLFDLKAAGFKDPILVAATDGVGTKIGDIGYGRVYGLAFGDDGSLFGYTANQDQLELDLGTGVGTFVRKISGLNSQEIWGATSEADGTAVPEPGMTLGLLSVGALFVGSRLQRK